MFLYISKLKARLNGVLLAALGYRVKTSSIHSLMTFLHFYKNRANIVIGDNTYVGKFVDIRVTSGSSLIIGNNAKIDDNVRIVVTNSSSLVISDEVRIGKGSVLNCGDNCQIGESTLISGYCYIQCSSHQMSSNNKIRDQAHDHKPITIGKDCMIGSHSFISPGSIMLEGSVCGTHSLVKGILEKYSIYAGIPVRYIRRR